MGGQRAKAEARHQSYLRRSVTLLGALLIDRGSSGLGNKSPDDGFWNFLGSVDSEDRTGMTICAHGTSTSRAACPSHNNAFSRHNRRQQLHSCTLDPPPDAGKTVAPPWNCRHALCAMLLLVMPFGRSR